MTAAEGLLLVPVLITRLPHFEIGVENRDQISDFSPSPRKICWSCGRNSEQILPVQHRTTPFIHFCRGAVVDLQVERLIVKKEQREKDLLSPDYRRAA